MEIRQFWSGAARMAAVALVLGQGGSPAPAGDVTAEGYFGWLSVGASYQVDDTHLYWVGQFSGALGGKGEASPFDNASIQCPGTLYVNTADGTAKGSGYCLYTTNTGDKAAASWQCEGGAPMSGKSCDGAVTFISGSGKLAGITGGAAFQATTVAFHADGTGSGYSQVRFAYTLPQ